MSSNYPPNPYFPNINFNNAFWSAGVGNYITLSYANSHYLFSTGTATSTATTTFFSGSVGIGTSASGTAGNLGALSFTENGVLLATKYQSNLNALSVTAGTANNYYPPLAFAIT